MIFLVYYLPLTDMKLLLLLALATVVRGHGNMVKPLAIWDEQQGTIHLRLLPKNFGLCVRGGSCSCYNLCILQRGTVRFAC